MTRFGNNRVSMGSTLVFPFYISQICVFCWCLAGRGAPWADLWSTTSWEWATWLALRFTSPPAGPPTSCLALVRSEAPFCRCRHGCVVRSPWAVGRKPGVADTSPCHLLCRGPPAAGYSRCCPWPPSPMRRLLSICLATSGLAPCVNPSLCPGSRSPTPVLPLGKFFWVQLLHVGSLCC